MVMKLRGYMYNERTEQNRADIWCSVRLTIVFTGIF